MSFNRDGNERIRRQVKRNEQNTTPHYRVRQRRQGPAIGGGKTTALIWARYEDVMPRAYFSHDPDDCQITAVEVELFQLVPKNDEQTKPGEPGLYKFEALLDGDEPQKEVVANFGVSDIAKMEWFAVLPTSGSIKAATVWSC